MSYAESVVVDGSAAVACCEVSGKLIIWANLTLLSLSKHRDANRVMGIGSSVPLGIVLGPRIVGGSLMFTSFDRDAWEDVMQTIGMDSLYSQADQIPPFTIIASIPIHVMGATSLNTNKGKASSDWDVDVQAARYFPSDTEEITVTTIMIEGIRLLDEAQLLGVEKISFEQQYSFIATRATRLLSLDYGASDRTRLKYGDETSSLRMDLDEIPMDSNAGCIASLSSSGYRNNGSEYYTKTR